MMRKSRLIGFLSCYWTLLDSSMVEAAGVEPASEIHVSRETPCLVEFRRFRATRSEDPVTGYLFPPHATR
jgi:hypothetical protein